MSPWTHELLFLLFSILLLITSPCFPESYVSRGSLSSVSWGLLWASPGACLLTPCRWLYRLMVRAPWLLLWPLVCACLHRDVRSTVMCAGLSCSTVSCGLLWGEYGSSPQPSCRLPRYRWCHLESPSATVLQSSSFICASLRRVLCVHLVRMTL